MRELTIEEMAEIKGGDCIPGWLDSMSDLACLAAGIGLAYGPIGWAVTGFAAPTCVVPKLAQFAMSVAGQCS